MCTICLNTFYRFNSTIPLVNFYYDHTACRRYDFRFAHFPARQKTGEILRNFDWLCNSQSHISIKNAVKTTAFFLLFSLTKQFQLTLFDLVFEHFGELCHGEGAKIRTFTSTHSHLACFDFFIATD